jgi:hypothetical protein
MQRAVSNWKGHKRWLAARATAISGSRGSRRCRSALGQKATKACGRGTPRFILKNGHRRRKMLCGLWAMSRHGGCEFRPLANSAQTTSSLVERAAGTVPTFGDRLRPGPRSHRARAHRGDEGAEQERGSAALSFRVHSAGSGWPPQPALPLRIIPASARHALTTGSTRSAM